MASRYINSEAAQIFDQYIDEVTILALSLCKMMAFMQI